MIKTANTGKRHGRAARVQPGRTFSDSLGRAGALKISFEPMGDTGPACRCNGSIIYLNTDIPAIKTDASDQEALSRHAIYAASTYFALKQPELFPTVEGEFQKIAQCAGHLLSKLNAPALTLANVG